LIFTTFQFHGSTDIICQKNNKTMKKMTILSLPLVLTLICTSLLNAQWFNDDMGTSGSGAAPNPWVNTTPACNPPGVTNLGMAVAGLGTASGSAQYFQGSSASGLSIGWNTTSVGGTGCTFTYNMSVTGSATINGMSFQVRRSTFGSPNIAVTLNGSPLMPSPNTFANLSTFTLITVAVPTPVTVTAGNMITVVITFTGGDAAQVTQVNRLDDFQLTGTTLPIELEKFEVNPSPIGINLEWATASERNSSHFEVQHSTNGFDYEQLARVKSAGDTRQRQLYNYTDATPRTGTHYYRLRMVDRDGSAEYSPVQTITIKSLRKLEIWPNPTTFATVNARLHTLIEGVAQIQMFDSGGRLCYETQIELAKGDNDIPIPSNLVQAGTYWLTATTGTEKIVTQLILQQ
jgi:hypothetical protein